MSSKGRSSEAVPAITDDAQRQRTAAEASRALWQRRGARADQGVRADEAAQAWAATHGVRRSSPRPAGQAAARSGQCEHADPRHSWLRLSGPASRVSAPRDASTSPVRSASSNRSRYAVRRHSRPILCEIRDPVEAGHPRVLFSGLPVLVKALATAKAGVAFCGAAPRPRIRVHGLSTRWTPTELSADASTRAAATPRRAVGFHDQACLFEPHWHLRRHFVVPART